MLDSSLSIDPVLARLTRSLALLARCPPQLGLVRRHGKTAEQSFDRFAAGFECKAPDVPARAHAAYLDALVLAKTLSWFVTDDRVTRELCVRFRRTAVRMLDVLESFVATRDRALRYSLLGAEQVGPIGRYVARA